MANLPAAGPIESISLPVIYPTNLPAAGPITNYSCRPDSFPTLLPISLPVTSLTYLPAILQTNLLYVGVVLKLIQPTWLNYDLSLWRAVKLR